jgi:hypothetical protein
MDAIRAYLTYSYSHKTDFTNGCRVTYVQYVFKAYGLGDGRVMRRHSTFNFTSSPRTAHSGSGREVVPIVDAATIYGAVLCCACAMHAMLCCAFLHTRAAPWCRFFISPHSTSLGAAWSEAPAGQLWAMHVMYYCKGTRDIDTVFLFLIVTSFFHALLFHFESGLKQQYCGVFVGRILHHVSAWWLLVQTDSSSMNLDAWAEENIYMKYMLVLRLFEVHFGKFASKFCLHAFEFVRECPLDVSLHSDTC